MLKKYVLFVEENLHEINTLKSKHVTSIAEQSSVTVTTIIESVY